MYLTLSLPHADTSVSLLTADVANVYRYYRFYILESIFPHVNVFSSVNFPKVKRFYVIFSPLSIPVKVGLFYCTYYVALEVALAWFRITSAPVHWRCNLLPARSLAAIYCHGWSIYRIFHFCILKYCNISSCKGLCNLTFA